MIRPEIADRLGKFIRLLGSDKDGEVLAAASAISRTLAAEHLDYHALAAAIGARPMFEMPARPPRPERSGGEPFNYANHFEEADPVGSNYGHPDVLTRKFGLRIYMPEWVEPWWEVARHCLEINHETPKRHGGKFLRDFEIVILDHIRQRRRSPTNAQASWIETVVARCHQARAAHAKAKAADRAKASDDSTGAKP